MVVRWIDFYGVMMDKCGVMNSVNFNGDLMDRSDAMVAIGCDGVQLGMGVFETMLAVDGEIDGLDLHMLRLKKGMDRLGYAMSLNETLQEVINEVLQDNDLLMGKARVRVTTMQGVCMVEANSAPERSETCTVEVSDYVCNERSATAGLKCSSYANNLLALKAGQSGGADEVIMLNSKGEVAEAAMANLFIVKNGVIITPNLASGCLAGVTRELVMRRCRAAGIEVREEAMLTENVMNADEVFLTNSLVGVRGVWKIGSTEVIEGAEGEKRLGKMTMRVRGIYRDGDQ